MGWYGEFRPYVSAAQRRARAAKEVARRTKKGESISPVKIEGKAIASTFWGKAWCTNLEGYSDFANRLPRGRTYVRNGSVVDLKVEKGKVTALVSGSELYEVEIDIAALPKQKWSALKARCAGRIGTLVELLQGKLSKAVMETVTDREKGLFPKPKEITMSCSCPDYAGMCKHIAATMYGVGNRLDKSPELLFTLRCVDHTELIGQAIPAPLGGKSGAPVIATDELGDIFGIEIGGAPAPQKAAPETQKTSAAKKTTKKPVAKKKTVPKKG
ncbi:MAG: SWIM zinc finger family protein [Planctomycetes bacterium]|nr:SWIM zinc finger family protein [Planctomycetota bacterium]